MKKRNCENCVYYAHPADHPDLSFKDCMYDGDMLDEYGFVFDLPCDYLFGDNDEELN